MKLTKKHYQAVEKRGTKMIKVNNYTSNIKLGDLAVTFASQVTCPKDCAFLNAGCYAETGPMSWVITSKLNTIPGTALEAAKLEAAGIDQLPANKTLRLHVVGDSATNKAAKIVAAASARYLARVKFAYHKVYTYTHAWRKVARSSWGPVSVLASCETIADTKLALKRGYASALVVDHHNGPNAYMLDGMRVIPCPQQTKGITCDKCRLCTDDQYLKSVSGVIAFAAHGVRTKMVKEKLIQLS